MAPVYCRDAAILSAFAKTLLISGATSSICASISRRVIAVVTKITSRCSQSVQNFANAGSLTPKRAFRNACVSINTRFPLRSFDISSESLTGPECGSIKIAHSAFHPIADLVVGTKSACQQKAKHGRHSLEAWKHRSLGRWPACTTRPSRRGERVCLPVDNLDLGKGMANPIGLPPSEYESAKTLLHLRH